MPRVKRSQHLPSIQTMQFVDDKERNIVSDVDLSSFDANSVLEDMFPPTNITTNVVMKEEEEEVEEGELAVDHHKCPLCLETLQYDEVDTKRGVPWRYYRCPAVANFTKCFVACGADDVTLYLHRVKDTLHPSTCPDPTALILPVCVVIANSRSYLPCRDRTRTDIVFISSAPRDAVLSFSGVTKNPREKSTVGFIKVWPWIPKEKNKGTSLTI